MKKENELRMVMEGYWPPLSMTFLLRCDAPVVKASNGKLSQQMGRPDVACNIATDRQTTIRPAISGDEQTFRLGRPSRKNAQHRSKPTQCYRRQRRIMYESDSFTSKMLGLAYILYLRSQLRMRLTCV